MIFVVGTGRCGSSTLARVLHQSGVCCMGHTFLPPDQRNPQGYWEDRFIRKRILFEIADCQTPPSKIYQQFRDYHDKHKCWNLIGYKHPLLAEVPRQRWIDLKYDHIFWSVRSKEMVIDSLRRWAKYNSRYNSVRLRDSTPEAFWKDKWTKLVEHVEGLPRVTKIDFSEKRTDKWIVNEIEKAGFKPNRDFLSR